MNRYDVYEWLKQSYMFSGTVPAERDCIAKFGGIVIREEIQAGINEFEITTHCFVERVRIYSRRGA